MSVCLCVFMCVCVYKYEYVCVGSDFSNFCQFDSTLTYVL